LVIVIAHRNRAGDPVALMLARAGGGPTCVRMNSAAPSVMGPAIIGDERATAGRAALLRRSPNRSTSRMGACISPATSRASSLARSTSLTADSTPQCEAEKRFEGRRA